MRVGVRLRKSVTTSTLAPVVPQDLESHDDGSRHRSTGGNSERNAGPQRGSTDPTIHPPDTAGPVGSYPVRDPSPPGAAAPSPSHPPQSERGNLDRAPPVPPIRVGVRRSVPLEDVPPGDPEGALDSRAGSAPTGTAGPRRQVVVFLRKADEHPRVSKAIAKMHHEGIPHDQAIAKALAMERAGRLDDEGEYLHVGMEKGVTTFRHPTTGEERKGTVHALGLGGATIVDDDTGEAHQVAHGQYTNPVKAKDGKKEDGPGDWKKATQDHLELGPRSRLAVHAAACHAAEAGCTKPHELKRDDVKVSGNRTSFGVTSKVDDPYVAATMRWLKQQPGDDRDLFSWQGAGGKRERLTAESLAAYRSRLGQVGSEEDKGDGYQAAKAMRKAVDDVDLAPLERWKVQGYDAVLRKSAIGLHVLSLEGGGLALPFHVLVRNPGEAHRIADEAATDLRKGHTPKDGVFRALDLPRLRATPTPEPMQLGTGRRPIGVMVRRA